MRTAHAIGSALLLMLLPTLAVHADETALETFLAEEAKDPRVTLRLQNVSIGELLAEMANQTSINMRSDKELDDLPPMSWGFTNSSLSSVFELLKSGAGLCAYRAVDEPDAVVALRSCRTVDQDCLEGKTQPFPLPDSRFLPDKTRVPPKVGPCLCGNPEATGNDPCANSVGPQTTFEIAPPSITHRQLPAACRVKNRFE